MIGFANGVEHLLWRQACGAIRRGEFDRAGEMLLQWDQSTRAHAACLNVLGVLAVARSNWKEAARSWRGAVRADPTYRPARQNLRRYYELFQFGRSKLKIALGDEPEFGTSS